MNRSFQIFVACCFGSLIGGVVALQSSHYWWLGGIVGFVAGYLAYDPKVVWRAIPVAAKAVRQVDLKENLGFAVEVMQPFFFIAISTPFWYPLMYWMERPLSEGGTPTTPFMLIIFSATAAMCSLYPAEKFGEKYGKYEKWVYCLINPVGLFLMGLYFLYDYDHRIKIARAFVAITNWLATWPPKFVWQLFKLIHSEWRLLCGCDAALGVYVGYFSGHALLGALAGGLFGLANYELVSKRWLKLVPAT